MNVPPLPKELVDQILSQLANAYSSDPATHWTYGRHLSVEQKRGIEQHFKTFWLPKLCITLHYGSSWHYNYRLSNCSEDDDVSTADFNLDEESSHGTQYEDFKLKEAWAEEGTSHVYLRLGEDYLRTRLLKTYVINDTELPSLNVGPEGLTISFDWVGAMDALLREEVMLRQKRKDLLKAYESKSGQSCETIPKTELVKHYVMDFHLAARVAVFKHRHERAKTTSFFHEHSQNYHRQPPNKLRPEHTRDTCYCCSRTEAPDIFEVLSQEESTLPFIPGFQQWSDEDFIDMLAEEHSWRCVQCQGKWTGEGADEEEWRLGRKSTFAPYTMEMWEQWVEGRIMRWDMLG